MKAHIRWFHDLRKAVQTGESDLAPAVVGVDTECDFGTWAYSELPALAAADLVEEIKRLHAHFHRTAASILALALTGRHADAAARLGDGSELGELSKSLIQKVHELR